MVLNSGVAVHFQGSLLKRPSPFLLLLSRFSHACPGTAPGMRSKVVLVVVAISELSFGQFFHYSASLSLSLSLSP